VSTRCSPGKRAPSQKRPHVAVGAFGRLHDLVEQVALVASAKRRLLLRVHWRRLRLEDLEDCYSQATLELIAHVKAGGSFAGRAHIGNALELRFLSRVRDRRRALGGRSPIQAALEHAYTLGELHGDVEIVDRRVATETLVIVREELRRIGKLVALLSDEQRLVLASQLSGETCAELCDRCGFSREKYRKVAQRARARLRVLMDVSGARVPDTRRPSEGLTGPTYDYVSPHS
jgi:DNA-directed RNA polymerase specialized sigma24 family protein